MSVKYWQYLQLDRLLELQEPHSDPAEHDESLFIIIHQVYELWFKLLLHELDKVASDFSGNDLFGALHTLKRMRAMMKTLVGQLDILETMTPMSFTSFRDRLETSSGFQSEQFRMLEFALGFKRPEVLAYLDAASPLHDRVIARLNGRSLMDHFYDFLESNGVAIPEPLRSKGPRVPNQANAQIQEALLRLYKQMPAMALLFEQLTDFDEGLQEWRYRHVKLVERTIGNKDGTGGSPGVEFLKQTLFRPAFPDLWAIRHRL